MSEHEFSADMTSLSEGGGSVDGLLGQAVREIQAMQAEPAVVAKHLRVEPRGKGKKVNIHIIGNGFGDDPGRVIMAASPPRPMNIQKWHNKKIVIKGDADTFYTEMTIYKKDGTIAAVVNIGKQIHTGNGVPQAPAWTISETEALADGIHVRGTGLDFVESAVLYDDTFPAEEFVGTVVSQSATEIVVAYPAGQDTPLERMLLCANNGITCQEIIADDFDVNAGTLYWRNGWTRPPLVNGWFASREAGGDIVITFTGEGFDVDDGDITLVTAGGGTAATIRSWDRTSIEVDADADTEYLDFSIALFNGQPVPEQAGIIKPIITPADLASVTSMDSPAIKTVRIQGTGFDHLNCVDLNSTAGVFTVFNEDATLNNNGAMLNLANNITLNTWSDTEVNATADAFGGESFDGAIFFDQAGIQNEVAAVPSFPVAAAPAVPTITGYAVSGADDNVLEITGVLLDQWDEFRLIGANRRDSNDTNVQNSIMAQGRKPGSNADSTLSFPPGQDVQASARDDMNKVKSWSDTLIELYMDNGAAVVPEAGFYSSDFVETAYTWPTTNQANRIQVHNLAVANGADMKDDPAGRGAIPELLNTVARDVGRNWANGAGGLGNHTVAFNPATNNVVITLNQVSNPVDGDKVSSIFIQGSNPNFFRRIAYNEGVSDLHPWDDPTTPASLNAAGGITVNSWTADTIDLTVPNFAGGDTITIGGFTTGGRYTGFFSPIAFPVPVPDPAFTSHVWNAGSNILTINGSNLVSNVANWNTVTGNNPSFGNYTAQISAQTVGPYVNLVSVTENQVVFDLTPLANFGAANSIPWHPGSVFLSANVTRVAPATLFDIIAPGGGFPVPQ